ncbi:MAG: hypothetical protein AB1486_10760 [Planctomycetota bacterium]
MFLHSACRAGAALLVAGSLALDLVAQVAAVNGTSTAPFASGLQGPSSISRNAAGVLYVASIYDKNGSGQPTDIFRVLPDGTVELFTPSLVDPDVLCLDAAGFVYAGAYGGKITRIDPTTGNQTLWAQNATLGNVDGMIFDASGDLLISAIDHVKIHKVNKTTKAVSLFADLRSLPVTGLGSLAIDPADQSVFVASPNDGYLVKLYADGRIANGAFASGFEHMGQLAITGGFIYVSDNAAQAIYRVDLQTRSQVLFVQQIEDYAGGLVAVYPGEFYASRQTYDMAQGWIYRIAPMWTWLSGPAQLGTTVTLYLESILDAGHSFFLFFSAGDSGVPLPGGRTLPIDPLAFIGPYTGTLDAAGLHGRPLTIPASPALLGLTFYACWATWNPPAHGFPGVSEALAITIE